MRQASALGTCVDVVSSALFVSSFLCHIAYRSRGAEGNQSTQAAIGTLSDDFWASRRTGTQQDMLLSSHPMTAFLFSKSG